MGFKDYIKDTLAISSERVNADSHLVTRSALDRKGRGHACTTAVSNKRAASIQRRVANKIDREGTQIMEMSRKGWSVQFHRKKDGN